MSDHVVSAASTDSNNTPGNFRDDKIAHNSSRGDGKKWNPTVAATGNLTFEYQSIDGKTGKRDKPIHSNVLATSAAAPFVSGTIALMLQQNPDLTFEQVKNILQSTAHNDPNRPEKEEGAGIVNPVEAVRKATEVKK
jgi:subtilisin family serine protease